MEPAVVCKSSLRLSHAAEPLFLKVLAGAGERRGGRSDERRRRQCAQAGRTKSHAAAADIEVRLPTCLGKTCDVHAFS